MGVIQKFLPAVAFPILEVVSANFAKEVIAQCFEGTNQIF